MTDRESKAELFRRAQEERARDKAEREANKDKKFDNYEVKWTSLVIEGAAIGLKIVRLLGLPPSERLSGTDAKFVRSSWIKGSNNKNWPYVFPCDNKGRLDDSYILKRVIDKTLEGRRNKEKNARDYTWAGTPIFTAVRKNGNPDSQYESGWFPGTSFLINVIDRSRMDWHRENKQTLVLSKNYKASTTGEGAGRFDLGVPPAVLSAIQDQVLEYETNMLWDEFDIVIRKEGTKLDTTYEAFHTDDERRVGKILNDQQKALVVRGPLTQEELSWELWDFDKAYQPRSYKSMLGHLGQFFKMADGTFGNTTFYDELVTLAEKEAKDKGETLPSAEASHVQVQGAEVQSRPQETTQARPRPAVKESAQTEESWTVDSLFDGSFNGTQYVGIKSLNDDELSAIDKVLPDKSFSYHKTSKDGHKVIIYTGGSQNFKSPGFFHVDPLTGESIQPMFED